VTAAERREAVKFLASRAISERRACVLARISRSSWRYAARPQGQDDLAERLEGLARRYPRYGYRMLHQKLLQALRKAGDPRRVNVKRVRRLCGVLNLKVPRKQRRKRRGQGAGVPCRAEYPGHVWSYDFLHDWCENGRKLKVLTVLEEYTRLGLEIAVAHRMGSRQVQAVLERLFGRFGPPAFIRSDNGSEFIAKALGRWLKVQGVTTRHIAPGSPWQNGFEERFNGTVRGECLNLEVFQHVDQARAVCRLFLREYDHERPHSALQYQTPWEYAQACGMKLPAGAGQGNKELTANGSGALPPNPRDLALGAPPVGRKEAGRA
jgi:putative transposase